MAKGRKRHNDLPRNWTATVAERLSGKGIQVTKNKISKVYGGFEKSTEHQIEILQVILFLKQEFKIEKTEEAQLRSQLQA